MSKYKPEFCQKLIAHMSEGYSFESFAGVIKIGRRTLFRWVSEKEGNPYYIKEFAEAKDEAFQASLLFWEGIGIDGTKGELKGWNPAGWIFNMKNRFNWTNREDVSHQVTVTPHQYIVEQVERIESERKKIDNKV